MPVFRSALTLAASCAFALPWAAGAALAAPYPFVEFAEATSPIIVIDPLAELPTEAEGALTLPDAVLTIDELGDVTGNPCITIECYGSLQISGLLGASDEDAFIVPIFNGVWTVMVDILPPVSATIAQLQGGYAFGAVSETLLINDPSASFVIENITSDFTFVLENASPVSDPYAYVLSFERQATGDPDTPPTAASEPAGLAFLGLGLFGLIAGARRRACAA